MENQENFMEKIFAKSVGTTYIRKLTGTMHILENYEVQYVLISSSGK